MRFVHSARTCQSCGAILGRAVAQNCPTHLFCDRYDLPVFSASCCAALYWFGMVSESSPRVLPPRPPSLICWVRLPLLPLPTLPGAGTSVSSTASVPEMSPTARTLARTLPVPDPPPAPPMPSTAPTLALPAPLSLRLASRRSCLSPIALSRF